MLSDETYLQVGAIRRDDGIDPSTVPHERRLQLRAELTRAAGRVDLTALKKKNYSQFLSSVQQAHMNLKPVADFAQEFTLVMDANAHIDCAWLWRYLETIEIAKNIFGFVNWLRQFKANTTEALRNVERDCAATAAQKRTHCDQGTLSGL